MKRNNSRKPRIEQSRRPKKNPLKAKGIESVDYKDVETLRLFISDRHKIRSRRVTGLTPQQQRQVATAVKNAKAGQVRFRTDKNGIIHTSVGKVGFEAAALKQNVEALLSDLKRLKPSTSKGIYVKRVTLSTTMGPGLIIDQASLDA